MASMMQPLVHTNSGCFGYVITRLNLKSVNSLRGYRLLAMTTSFDLTIPTAGMDD